MSNFSLYRLLQNSLALCKSATFITFNLGSTKCRPRFGRKRPERAGYWDMKRSWEVSKPPRGESHLQGQGDNCPIDWDFSISLPDPPICSSPGQRAQMQLASPLVTPLSEAVDTNLMSHLPQWHDARRHTQAHAFPAKCPYSPTPRPHCFGGTVTNAR